MLSLFLIQPAPLSGSGAEELDRCLARVYFRTAEPAVKRAVFTVKRQFSGAAAHCFWVVSAAFAAHPRRWEYCRPPPARGAGAAASRYAMASLPFFEKTNSAVGLMARPRYCFTLLVVWAN